MNAQAGIVEEKAFLRGRVEYLRISYLSTKDASSRSEISTNVIYQDTSKNKNPNWSHLGVN